MYSNYTVILVSTMNITNLFLFKSLILEKDGQHLICDQGNHRHHIAVAMLGRSRKIYAAKTL